MKNKKILIIGAGWYGCHIAKSLIEKKYQVKVYEKSSGIFNGASSKNQNRLHQGYHYPRCEKTRSQSARGFHIFKKKYPGLTSKLDYNIYAISENASLIDYETYKAIMLSQGLKFEDITEASPIRLTNVSGLLDCPEEYICYESSIKYFEGALKGVIEFNKFIGADDLVNLKKEFDYVVDCTWGKIFPHGGDVYFETCLYYLLSSDVLSNIAITIMDGRLFSIFPDGKNYYTLTGVGSIVKGVYRNPTEAEQALKMLERDAEAITKIDDELLCLVSHYYPNFTEHFSFEKAIVSMKTKFESGTDSRYVRIYRDENYIGVLSGKIDTIFDAEAMITRIVSD